MDEERPTESQYVSYCRSVREHQMFQIQERLLFALEALHPRGGTFTMINEAAPRETFAFGQFLSGILICCKKCGMTHLASCIVGKGEPP
ncbi:hypothetical protein B0H14DRAFT_3500890 [Mycena olivaceomarginata]|nr:hypothetical protein B0H14DRAFT_3500890 [Mycena olivaceomarginata]